MAAEPTHEQTWIETVLRCPISHDSLQAASAEQLAKLNELQAAGRLRFRSGEPVVKPIQAGLINRAATYFYCGESGAWILQAGQAIDLKAYQL